MVLSMYSYQYFDVNEVTFNVNGRPGAMVINKYVYNS